MTYATPAETHKARLQHVCDWCGEAINPGANYQRWRYYGDRVSTVKAHPECFEAAGELASEWGADDVLFNRSDPRGCGCGFSKGCPTCEKRKELEMTT
jgi:hypothetical protein